MMLRTAPSMFGLDCKYLEHENCSLQYRGKTCIHNTEKMKEIKSYYKLKEAADEH